MNKYGIISTASIAARFIEGIRLSGDEILCIGSRDLEKAKKFAKNNNIPKYYGSYEEVYSDKDINVIYIPVINDLHYECAKQALNHHKHVVLEKPFTLTTKEARELFEIARKNNCLLFEGVKNIFMPSTEFVKQHLNDIGKVIRIETKQGIKTPFPEGHWMYNIKHGGGAYIGSASYVYHYLRYIFNCLPTNIDGTFTPCFNSDMSCHFTFNLNDIKVDSYIDMSKDLENTCIIYGEKGKIIIDTFWRSHHVDVYVNDEITDTFNDSGSEFVYEIKHFQECLNKGLLESPIMNEEASVSEVEYINCLYKKWNLI